MGNVISATLRRFLLIFAFDMLNVHHTTTSDPIYLSDRSRNCFSPHADNFH